MTVTDEKVMQTRLYIGGEWVEPSTDRVITPVSPSTEEVLGQVPEAAEKDVDRAVAGEELLDGLAGDRANSLFALADIRRHEPGGRHVLDLRMLGGIHVGQRVEAALSLVHFAEKTRVDQRVDVRLAEATAEDRRIPFDLHDVCVFSGKPDGGVALHLRTSEGHVGTKPGQGRMHNPCFVSVRGGENHGFRDVVGDDELILYGDGRHRNLLDLAHLHCSAAGEVNK